MSELMRAKIDFEGMDNDSLMFQYQVDFFQANPSLRTIENILNDANLKRITDDDLLADISSLKENPLSRNCEAYPLFVLETEYFKTIFKDSQKGELVTDVLAKFVRNGIALDQNKLLKI